MAMLLARAALFTLVVLATPAGAQAWPERPIRIVIPFTPGGPADVQARLIGPKLTEAWGQPVVIDNRAGANGIIGTDLVAKAKPDGYTLTIISGGHTINATLYPKLPFDAIRDFTTVSQTSAASNIVMVHPSLPVRSISELIVHGRDKSNRILYVSAGNGSPSHLAVELFKVMTQTQMVHVPYKGSTPATIDLLAGHVHMSMPNISVGLPHARTGKLRALAVTSPKRALAAPELPTVAESGVPGYSAMNWFGVVGPAGMPRGVVQEINQHVAHALRAHNVQESMRNVGLEPTPSTPDELAGHLKSEVAKWARVIRAAGVRLEQ